MDDVVPFSHLPYWQCVGRMLGGPDEKIDYVFAPPVHYRRHRTSIQIVMEIPERRGLRPAA